jgi:hypothetical protein
MTKAEELKKRGELVVHAPSSRIYDAVQIVLGAGAEIETKGDTITFTARSVVCPSQIVVRKLGEEEFHVVATSKCTIKNCPYWERCAEMDAERLLTFEITLNKLLGKGAVKEARYTWKPELGKEVELQKILARFLRKVIRKES